MEEEVKLNCAPVLSEDKKKTIATIIEQARFIIDTYAATDGDMSLIETYDELKKQSLSVLATFTDILSEMRSKMEHADDKVKALRSEVAVVLMSQGKSATAADMMSKSDELYLKEIVKLEEYSEQFNRLRYTYQLLDNTHKALVQSVSLARVGMIKESYNV